MQWVIAAGYVLVALIVLLNYILQRSEERARRYSSGLSAGPVAEDAEVLRQRLVQEQQRNREMAALMQQMQNSFLSDRSRDPATSGSEAATPVDPSTFHTMVPDLAPMVWTATSTQANPFIAGKNPYRPFYRQESAGRNGLVLTGPTDRIAHPAIPQLVIAEVSGVQWFEPTRKSVPPVTPR